MEVEFTEEFREWWDMLEESQQDDVAHSVGLLAELGPSLAFPHSSGISGSRHGGMRELRTQSGRRPLRALYAFNPTRTALLLIGGDKTGDDRWYERFVPLADRIYDRPLAELKRRTKEMPARKFSELLDQMPSPRRAKIDRRSRDDCFHAPR